jgi:hypothetical protein
MGDNDENITTEDNTGIISTIEEELGSLEGEIESELGSLESEIESELGIGTEDEEIYINSHELSESEINERLSNYNSGDSESCPNFVEDSKYDRSWITWSTFNEYSKDMMNEDELLEYNKTCFDICGEGYYIQFGECIKCGDNFYQKDDDDNILMENNNYLINLDSSENPNNDPLDRCDYLNQQFPLGWFENSRENYDIDDDASQYALTLSNEEEGGEGYAPLWWVSQKDSNLITSRGQRRIDPDTGELLSDEESSNFGDDDESINERLSIINNFRDFLQGPSMNREFESCINEKLRTSDDNEDAILGDDMSKLTSIKQLSRKHKRLIRKKLIRISNLELDDMSECIRHINMGESVCKSGIADKLLMIFHLILNIMGNNLIDINDDSEQYEFNKFIEEFGPYLMKAIKNLIKISMEYESVTCPGGQVSRSTIILEKLYETLYETEKNKNINISFDPTFSITDLIDTSMFSHIEFVKMVVLLIIGVFFIGHIVNLIIAFMGKK